jgi:hypothetical protein
LSQQLLQFGRSGDGLEVLTFGVELFLVLSARRGWSASALFVVCSSCSCSPSFSIRCDFEFWLGEVSDGPRVPGGQSVGAWQTVRVLPADGLLFGFYLLFRIVRGSGPDGPRCGCGQSTAAGWTVRVACADSSPLLAGRSARAWLLCSLVQFLSPFFRASTCPSRNCS